MAFRKATRAGTKSLIGLFGGSGGGKTYSALLLARGLVGDDGNVLMGDTESRRGEMYVGQEGIGEYEVQPIEAPYSSAKYIELIQDASQIARDSGKPTALIIDSMSHEWEGLGGVVNAAETISEARAKKKNYDWNGSVSFGDWKQPKADHKRMVLAMLGAPIHVIVCLRGQYKSRQIERKDFEKFNIPSSTYGNSVVVRDEFQSPIQDAGFIYEMTISVELRPTSAGLPFPQKCPAMLHSAFPQGKKIDNATGAAIAAWCDGGGGTPEGHKDEGKTPDFDPEGLIQEAYSTAGGGMDIYRDWYGGIGREKQTVLNDTTAPDHDDFDKIKSVHEICKIIADKADKTA